MNDSRASTLEVDCHDQNWMVQVGKFSRVADRLVIKHFKPTSSTIPFVKSISADNNLFIRSCDENLVLEKVDKAVIRGR